jgi:superfamily II DNA/RNA helicase
MEGIQIIKLYLEQFGYKNYRDKSSEDGFRYTEFHGDIDKNERSENIVNFNKKSNMYGKDIKVTLIAPAGAEGINFKHIEQIFVEDPYWNEVRIRQLIGRGLRMDSHIDLPEEEKFVEIYRLYAITDDDKPSTDQKIFRLAENKERSLESLLQAIRETSIDCELFKKHNMAKSSYSCFKFNESSYFNKLVGPAYKEDLFYDKKMNEGSNSSNSITKNIKTYKIKGQVKIGEGEYANPKEYWYYPQSGVVYDLKLNYPIGKVYKTNGIPHRINNIYVIDQVIDIPKVV